MSDSKNSSSSGIGLASLLGVAFIVLKLTHVIDWSWWWVTAPFWWVTAPFWAPVAVVLAFLLALSPALLWKAMRK